MEIYVLRHGIAENAVAGHPDPERALTAEGREKLRRVLKRARTAGVKPDLILASPYRRAMETAEAAAEELGYKGTVERSTALVPDASPHDIWAEISARKSENAILLASHEPLTSSLAAFLLGCPALQVEMKKAALLRVDCERLGAEPRCLLKWLITPGLAGE